MKTFLLLFCLIPAAGLLSITPNTKSNEITLNITCKNCAGKEVDGFFVPVLENEPKPLFRSKFDSSGVTEIKLGGADTLVVYMNFHDKDSSWFLPRVYLEPGTRLDVNFQKGAATFHGNLGAVNNYLQKTMAVYRNVDRFHNENKFRNTNFQNIRSTSDAEKETYLTTLRAFGQELDAEIERDQSLSRYYKNLLINVNAQFVVKQSLSFDFDKLQAAMGEATATKKPKMNAENFFSGISVNPYLLKFKDSNYVFYLRLNVNMKLFEALQHYWENVDSKKVPVYDFIQDIINKTPEFAGNADLFMAMCLSTDLETSGIAYEDLVKIVNCFEKDYPHSAYLSDLQEILQEHESLKKGMPLKDFTMLNMKGDTFKLSDLKGKLIYIDVWATWCGPCVAEFKYSKKLAKRYANRRDLLFLYVSKDSKTEEWKKFLDKNPSLTGLHAIQPSRDVPIDDNDIMHLYKINGIPRYILIGKDGNIINYNATRPSELVNNKYLDSLLAL